MTAGLELIQNRGSVASAHSRREAELAESEHERPADNAAQSADLAEVSPIDGEIFFALDTQSTKLVELFKLLHLYGDQPVAIYTDSKRFAKVTTARLQAAGYNAAEWSGDVSSKQRDEIKQGFLDRKIQYLVAVIPAFSTGLDGFQTVCNKIAWLSESKNHILNNQALVRFFRPGRQGNFEHV